MLNQDDYRAGDAAQSLEAERRRITELLEYDVAESLHLLVAQAHAYEQSASGNTQARLTASVLGSLALQALQRVRDLQANLHPTVLNAHGMVAALEILASQTAQLYGLQVDLTLPHSRTRWPAALELALFRVIQVWLSQVRSQAHASSVAISIVYQPPEVTVRLWHNGGLVALDVLHHAFAWLQSLGGAIEYAPFAEQDRTEILLRIAVAPDIALTEREIDVLRLLLEGRANKDIALQLKISVRTVKFHLDNLYSKIGVNSRVEAVIFALQHGLHKR
jgi:DNA-binding CsgD family transcriptional regulator